MTNKPQKIETPEINPDKWREFEATVKRMLATPHRSHAPTKGRRSQSERRASPRGGLVNPPNVCFSEASGIAQDMQEHLFEPS